MTNLEDIIRRGQDRLRGRPRNWRDDLGDWWRGFSLYDLIFNVYAALSIAYVVAALVAITMIAMGYIR